MAQILDTITAILLKAIKDSSGKVVILLNFVVFLTFRNEALAENIHP